MVVAADCKIVQVDQVYKLEILEDSTGGGVLVPPGCAANGLAGNTPPFSPVQAFPGGRGTFAPGNGASGGGTGGAGEVGSD